MRRFVMILSVLTLALSLTVPACALEYTFDGAEAGNFGKPTSIETVVTPSGGAAENADRSKNAALIPPGFGTATADLPGSGGYLNPDLAPGGKAATGVTINGGTAATVIPGSTLPAVSTSTQYTSVTSDLYYSGGYLGTLKIPAIDLSVKIYQGTDSSTLKKGAGHFEETSIWDGNVALAAHNRGTNSYFGEIHTLDIGDKVSLTTKLGTRTYKVISVEKVSETDRSALTATTDNCITLYTCVRNERDQRWCVRALENV